MSSDRFALSSAHPVRTALAWALIVPVAIVGWIIAWLDRLIGFPLPFPRDLAALEKRRAWWVKALPAGAVVHDVALKPLGDTVAFRSESGFATVTFDEGAERKTLECFVKFAPKVGSIWNRCVFNLQGNAMKETLFNAHLASDPAVAAPKVYFAQADPVSGNLCLVTERMPDAVEYREDAADVKAEHVELALDGLARLHARFWNQTASQKKVVSAISDTVVGWFDSLVAFGWSRAARRLLVQSWVRQNEPQTVLHGDARIGNMLFPSAQGRGRFVLIDWQAVRAGKAAFDLAYLLVLSLTTQRRQEIEQASIDTYYRQLVAHGVTGYSRDDLSEDYRHACICVLVLLSLPLLSGEASADAAGANIFFHGMHLWRARVEAKFAELDFAWVASRYGVSEEAGRAAIAEMLSVIERRLARIQARAQT